MNSKIKELSEQCYERHPILDTYQFNKHKFAELIIRECLSDLKERIALRYQGSDKDCDIGYGMEIVYWEIVDKFGVEV
jgi:hypothetical protein